MMRLLTEPSKQWVFSFWLRFQCNKKINGLPLFGNGTQNRISAIKFYYLQKIAFFVVKQQQTEILRFKIASV